MGKNYEAIEVHQTWLGELVLRRHRAAHLDNQEVYEITLDDQFLMSGLFNHSEIALAELGLAAAPGDALDVVIGGLGLGCTAVAALDMPRVRSLLVVECLQEVIGWHHRALVPLGARISGDARCRLVHGDFFALAGPEGAGFDDRQPGRQFDAILMDIDHSPRALLHGTHWTFYEPEGLRHLARNLRPGGVFALWSADPTEPEFVASLEEVFASHQVHEVEFFNPVWDRRELNSVYVARTAA